jgi:predicted DNA-binding transcriptional regulator YafY
MNRIDRLFAILLKLQSKSPVTSHNLAGSFEVSQRTVYRDIAALSEMGVPIVALPGEGYTLMEGYYLPPLIFTPDEAVALFLGARMLAGQAAGSIPNDAEQALAKIAHALPDHTRQHVEQLNGIIQFFLPENRFNLDDPRLLTLQTAILEHRLVHLRYHSQSRDELTVRDIEPHALLYYNGNWYVNGYCRLRQDARGFRLERIEAFTLRDETFQPRPLKETPAEKFAVRVRIAHDHARWVRERQHYAFQSEESTPQGILMTYCVDTVDTASEIRSWLLGWGAAAEVLSPQSLRDDLRREAQKLVEMLT